MTLEKQSPKFRAYVRRLRSAGYDGIVQGLKLRRAGNGDVHTAEVNVADPLSPQMDDLGGGSIVGFDTAIDDDGIDWLILDIGHGDFSRSHLSPPTTDTVRAPEPYWAPIRSYIGKDVIYSPGTCILVEDGAGRIAVVKRTDDGQWSLPAGAREPGEAIAHTAVSEVQEETSLRIRLTDFVAVISGPSMAQTYPNGHQQQFTSFLFRAAPVEGTLAAADSENTDARWVTPDQALDLFNDHWAARLRMFFAFDGEVQIF